VYELPKKPAGAHSAIASIVAVTRVSEEVAAITKVYADDACRRGGCASSVIRVVAQHYRDQKKRVVLYVAREKETAKGAYERCGFKELSDWIEIGFARDEVELGYW